MKNLLLQMNISLDGFVGDAEGKVDWMLPETDPKQIEFLKNLTSRVGVIVLGRKMASESIPHWEKVARSEEKNPEVEFAKFFVKTPKVVFSKSADTIVGDNTAVESGHIKGHVDKLKAQSQKDIIVYGGAGLVASLIEQKLIDELNLFVHPVSLGRGLSIFKNQQKFELRKSEKYGNGIVLNQYTIATHS
jgi:dihydrofolate reductase